MSSGLGGGVGVECDGDYGRCIVCAAGVPKSMAGVFPVGELEGQDNTHELEAAVEEEEQVVCLPACRRHINQLEVNT